MKILIAGGTGMVGIALTNLLEKEGYEVRILTRNKRIIDQVKYFYWDVDNQEIDENCFTNIDGIVNLAGEGIADKRWTDARKKALLESRVKPSKFLDNVLKEKGIKLPLLINASAIGYYGDTGSLLITEEFAPQSDDFMVKCCQYWEQVVNESTQFDRKVILRIGIVLSKKGGALPEILRSFLFRLGVYFGDGKQFYSYIHIHDLCRMILFSIQNKNVSDVYNAVSDNPVSNYEFTKTVGKVLGGFALYIPAPTFAMKLILGEMSAVVLNSNNVSNKKIKAAGFKFEFQTLENCLKSVLND